MQSILNANLRCHHTFAIEQTCQQLVAVNSIEELIEVYQAPQWAAMPKLVLGKGSNMLFTQPYQGVVVLNRLMGKQVTQSMDAWHLHISAGEDWPSLVAWCVEKGYWGIENLALIPGCAGSAPIQNIGAYGVEFKDICEYVDVLHLDTFQVERMSAQACQFGYRDSIFKHQLYQKVVIVAVGLKLATSWLPKVEYGPLKEFANGATAQQIFQRVCQIRMEKLPDPAISGNAGSFFKNPVIDAATYQQLIQQYPNAVVYPVEEGYKVAAGWLIDQCGLKGYMIGGAQVHPNQALVIVNKDHATANDVVQLAAHVSQTVLERYGIQLEHEVRFMDATQETCLENLIGEQE
ncbi:UDP-N-acetylmuramate dehydrogenase [Vibrio sinensis]|uniref:UDP-N-acetylenolpyruvoylglucosamine reductase n=1 Tax=Vibrio sinensis TaxID=2302434 RepID=A0A3A6QIB6_9VIBR|nr:UDP-N-acetylmuramate dehydrogenase [Vibrio sinensis]RJX72363.1 UDP-N-acetylmuramate dehydrogenase [Vibrio sinensis]